MKLEFKAQRRNVPDSELIEDVQHCARRLQRNTITIADYETQGAFHPATLTRRFGSWFRVQLRVYHSGGLKRESAEARAERLIREELNRLKRTERELK